MNPPPTTGEPPVSIVLLTYNRVQELEHTLAQLLQLPERPPLVVVDNASTDGTAARIGERFPQLALVRCPRNLGAAARNAGVARVRTPYVAFCDDDTWWAPGALRRAAALLDRHPALAAVQARVLVGPQQRTDPTCDAMARSPLDLGPPGPGLIAFMAGAVVMRTRAFVEAGGYEPRFFLGAEEALLALDLVARGWRMAYVADVVTHHHPSAARDARGRRLLLARNRLWVAWMRLPAGDALGESWRLLRAAAADGQLWPCLREAGRGLGWALRRRRVLPPAVLQLWRRVNRPPRGGALASAATPEAGS
jgi:GT2 family glycosyltransferase